MLKPQIPNSYNNNYISQIIQAQNKMRCKFPYIISYKPDKHFQYLSHNTKTISLQTLTNLIPFKYDYAQFQPVQYLANVIYYLNTGKYSKYGNVNDDDNGEYKQSGLEYRGYVQLVSCERPALSGGSEVNYTLFNRVTMHNQIYTKMKPQHKIEQANKRANPIVGILLFLQCLQQSQRQSVATKQYEQQNRQLPNDRNKESIVYTYEQNQRQKFNNMHKQKYENKQKYKLSKDDQNQRMNRNLAKVFSFMQKQQINYKNKLNQHRMNKYNIVQNGNSSNQPYYYYGIKTPRKSIFSFNPQYTNNRSAVKQQTQRNESYRTVKNQLANTRATNNEEQFYSPINNNNNYQHNNNYNNNSNNERSKSAYPFLQRFSNEKNVWKNVAERNWDNKLSYTHRSSNNSSAFIYEQNTSPRSLYMKSPKSTTAKRPANKIDKAYYYLKQ